MITGLFACKQQGSPSQLQMAVATAQESTPCAEKWGKPQARLRQPLSRKIRMDSVPIWPNRVRAKMLSIHSKDKLGCSSQQQMAAATVPQSMYLRKSYET